MISNGRRPGLILVLQSVPAISETLKLYGPNVNWNNLLILTGHVEDERKCYDEQNTFGTKVYHVTSKQALKHQTASSKCPVMKSVQTVATGLTSSQFSNLAVKIAENFYSVGKCHNFGAKFCYNYYCYYFYYYYYAWDLLTNGYLGFNFV